MKKVTAFIGSARKKATFRAVKEFEQNLKRRGEVEFEYVFLEDYNLGFCRGCKLCFDKGEQFCPLKDDRDVLLQKMELSDGVIFATPNYAFQVSARMKNLLDRFSFIIHRPKFFGKTFTAIVTQGIMGGKTIRRYLENIAESLGFSIVRGASLTTLEPITDKQSVKMNREIEKASDRFYNDLKRNSPPSPTLFRLMLFRMTRSGLINFKVKYHDYYYFKEKGWLESDYFYEAPLSILKKAAGLLFDFIGRIVVKHV